MGQCGRPTEPCAGRMEMIVLLYILSCPLLTWGAVYIQSGSEISACNMKCPQPRGIVELYRQCGGKAEPLLEMYCGDPRTINNDKARLHLDRESGCWKLTQTGRRDSCVYIIEFHGSSIIQLFSIDIRVLDPVLISNITSNGSRLGEDMAVSVQFSGEESAVTWEVDGEPLPERYRLIDDNRTLIIPSVQRDDADRRFRVRITNPVSEEIQEYRPINDTMFIRMLEAEVTDAESSRRLVVGLGVGLGGVVPVILVAVMAYIIYRRRSKRRKKKEVIPEMVPLNSVGNGAVAAVGNGAVAAVGNGAVAAVGNGAVAAVGNGAVASVGNGGVATLENL